MSVACVAGGATQTHLNDFYEYHIRSRTWTQLFAQNPPPIRASHGMAAVDGKIYVFAGRSLPNSKCSACPRSRTRWFVRVSGGVRVGTCV
eukprot:3651284-Rhodomonas_salina.3